MSNITIQPLNLYKIFVNYFAGDINIFFFIFMIFLAFLAARFKMPNIITIMMFVLSVVFLADYYAGIYVLIIAVFGLVAYLVISRLIKS